MKKAIKKEGKMVEAYQLGTDSPRITELLAEGKIKRGSDGSYEIFSQETVNGRGETVQNGDYIKVDSKGFPYPNDKNFLRKTTGKPEKIFMSRFPSRLMSGQCRSHFVMK